MAFTKFASDQIFTGQSLLDQHSVLVTTEEGVVEDIVAHEDAGDDILQLKGMIVPGLINCHCHLELSHLKGAIPPHMGMLTFLLSVMNQRSATISLIESAISDAETQMYQTGTVAVADICNTDYTLLQKKTSRLYFHNFIEATGFSDSQAEQRFASAKQLFEMFRHNNSDKNNCQNTIVPHAPYSVSRKLLQQINSCKGNNLLSIHNQESEAEIEFLATGKGDFLELYKFLKTDIAWFTGYPDNSLKYVLNGVDDTHSLILVHNVHTTAADFEWIKSCDRLPQLYWCICARANLYIGNPLPNLRLFDNNHCNMVVGTDSLASNESLDLLEELKTIQFHFPELSLEKLFTWATSNGAKALGIDHQYGSFEKGKRPGVVLVENIVEGNLKEASSRRIL